jgi:uronate dehydrogenase
MKKVALSGASGNVGQVLRPALPAAPGITLRSAGGTRPLVPLAADEDVCHRGLRDPAVVDRLLEGVDVLVHMARTSVERPLAEIIENNLRALHAVYEGARRHGVRRVVFASSNHAIGMHSTEDRLALDCDMRPDGFYGLSKVWGEAMTRIRWDKHGIEGISIRIGSTIEKPTEPRHLSTWLGHDDLVPLILRCIEAPTAGYLVVWGVSNNTRSWWQPVGCERLGYHPVQNAEDYATEVLSRPDPLDALGRRFQGGSFAAMDISRPTSARAPSARWSGSDSWKHWAELRAGAITEKDWDGIENGIARSPGHCMTMGTASTMTSAAEALGMTLPYNDMAARIDNPDIAVDENSVPVLKNAGPLGAPGMPEWGRLPIRRSCWRRVSATWSASRTRA